MPSIAERPLIKHFIRTTSMSKQELLLLVIFIFFLLSFHGVYCTFSSICNDTLCNGVKISYPFWTVPVPQTGNNSTNLSCGYKGFGLRCDSDPNTPPILTLPGDTSYHVKNIDYDTQSITLAGVEISAQSCPRLRHNVTIGTLPLHFQWEDSLNLTFYFNCKPGLYGNDTANRISCLNNTDGSGNGSYVYAGGTESPGFDWTKWCEDKVVAPVKETELPMGNLGDGYAAAVNAGFVLEWGGAAGCGGCVWSGGRCGFNNRTEQLVCFCENSAMLTDGRICRKGVGGVSLKKKFVIAGAVGGTFVLTLVAFVFVICKRKRMIWKRQSKRHQEMESFIRNYGSSVPKRFKYSEVKKMTNSFKEKLGQGGFGAVYKGKLRNETLVAVKLLHELKGNGEDFINEVASISRTSHVNIVTLLGFCLEGSKRALIYEYMSNQSLDKFICGETPERHLGWEKLNQIALGIARGLEYLHRGCNTRILHFDIKPQNILLDDAFRPKISDFGLSKLCLKEESILSTLTTRGTIGYIAPEVFNRNFGGVSHKADVYSYRMMLIDMVGGIRKLEEGEDRSSQMYFADRVYRLLERDHDFGLHNPITPEENEIARKMVAVGIWCIQTVPSERPSISRVIELLEGNIQPMQMPPKPYLFGAPRQATLDSFSASESS